MHAHIVTLPTVVWHRFDFGRPENPAAVRSASASSSLPSSMTTRVWRRSPIRFDGSPSTSTRSATLPTLIEPVLLSWPDEPRRHDRRRGQCLGRRQARLDVDLELAHELDARAVGAGDDRHAGFVHLAEQRTIFAQLAR